MINNNYHNFMNHYYEYSTAIGRDPFNSYHAHHQMEILFIHRGKGRFILNQEITDFQSGMLIIIQPFQLHGVKVNSDTYERTRLHFEPSFFHQYIRALASLDQYYQFLWKQFLSRQWLILSGDYIPRLFQQLHIDLKAAGNESEQFDILGVFLIMLLQHVKTRYSQEYFANYRHKQRAYHHAEKITNWIEQNYMNRFSMSELSKSLHLTPKHISFLFRQATGSSITEYIIARRMREACHLLANTSESIETIAYKIGYSSSSHFGSVFKNYVRFTPLQFRQKTALTFETPKATEINGAIRSS
ncbi:helix-turn-helix domain-containing protein [Paenibacillus tarimensis]